jgi:hypothetical protein
MTEPSEINASILQANAFFAQHGNLLINAWACAFAVKSADFSATRNHSMTRHLGSKGIALERLTDRLR